MHTTTQATQVTLPIEPQQRAQSEFDHFAPGLESAGAQGRLHQIVVDHDIGAHDVYRPLTPSPIMPPKAVTRRPFRATAKTMDPGFRRDDEQKTSATR
jgi:hypothetical protein